MNSVNKLVASRPYRMKKRAEALEETRNQIVWATMQLHAEKGAAATSQADIATRAGVAPATVYRHFPTLGSLVRACGTQIWTAVSPPRPEDSERLFAGLGTTRERLHRFVEEVSEFYRRAWLPLDSAAFPNWMRVFVGSRRAWRRRPARRWPWKRTMSPVSNSHSP